MARIGVTGHSRLPPDTAVHVYDLLVARLRPYADADDRLHGVTCLARGADQIFARAVVALEGTFEVVLPARDYRRRIVARGEQPEFDELLGRAVSVHCLPRQTSDRAAYMAASQELLGRIDVLFAVWDGRPPARLGDTADVVRAANARAVPITVVWPPKPQHHNDTTPISDI